MPLEQLIARLERDADAEVEAVRRRADAELEALEAEAARASDLQRDAELAARRARRQATLERELAAARQAARTAELRARHALLERVRARALTSLASPALEPRFAARLPSLLEEVLRYAGGEEVRLLCTPSLAPRVRELLGAQAGLSVVEQPGAPAGLRLVSADGSFEVDDTLASRLERSWPRLAVALLAELGP